MMLQLLHVQPTARVDFVLLRLYKSNTLITFFSCYAHARGLYEALFRFMGPLQISSILFLLIRNYDGWIPVQRYIL